MSQTLEQRRAAHALECVQALGEDKELRKSYRAYVSRLGPAILMNGLGQALATEWAASEGGKADKAEGKAHGALFQNVQAWLCREGGVYGPGKGLLEAITGEPEAQYLRAQAEALAWLEWHLKFCRAALPKEEE